MKNYEHRERHRLKNIMSEAEHTKFWGFVVKSDCWQWMGSVDGAGSGYMWINQLKRISPAARIAWQLVVGDIPSDKVVIHTCINRNCINPFHNRVGTRKDVQQVYKESKRNKQVRRKIRPKRLVDNPEQQEVRTKLNSLFADEQISKREVALETNLSRMTLISFCLWNMPIGKKSLAKLQKYLKDYKYDTSRV